MAALCSKVFWLNNTDGNVTRINTKVKAYYATKGK